MLSHVSYVSNSVPDLPKEVDYEVALTTPNGDGIYIFVEENIYELICDSNACKWITKKQRISDVGRDEHLAMYIDPKLTNCS